LFNVYAILKNVITLYCKVQNHQFTNYHPPKHRNNLFNPNMNNLMAIDFANKEITGFDGILSRWT
jgi:hypothetical protein